MRFKFDVSRPTQDTKLGLKYLGMPILDAAIVIVQIIPGGLVDEENKRILRNEVEPMSILEPGDIILSVNDCTKRDHGAEMMRATLQGDPQLTFQIDRRDFDPWDISTLPPEDPCKDPQGRCQPGQERLSERSTHEPRPYTIKLNVDPRRVRFTHDSINHKFQNGKSLDETIFNILYCNLKVQKFPPIELVQHEGALYSLSNRRLFVFRVVARHWPGYWFGACLYSFNHYRVQRLAVTQRGGQTLAPKWERAFTTRCNGLWVHVRSDYRWYQEPRPPLPDDKEQTITASTEDTSVQLQQLTHVVAEEKSRTDSFIPDAGRLVNIVGTQNQGSDNEELLVPPAEAEDTDPIKPSQLCQHESGMHKDNPEPSGKVEMEAIQEPAQDGVRVPLHKYTEDDRPKKCHNKIPQQVG